MNAEQFRSTVRAIFVIEPNIKLADLREALRMHDLPVDWQIMAAQEKLALVGESKQKREKDKDADVMAAVGKDLKNLFDQVHELQEWHLKTEKQIMELKQPPAPEPVITIGATPEIRIPLDLPDFDLNSTGVAPPPLYGESAFPPKPEPPAKKGFFKRLLG